MKRKSFLICYGEKRISYLEYFTIDPFLAHYFLENTSLAEFGFPIYDKMAFNIHIDLCRYFVHFDNHFGNRNSPCLRKCYYMN